MQRTGCHGGLHQRWWHRHQWLALVLVLASWLWLAEPARAILVQTQEPPDVTLVRSRHALQDADNRGWQAIAFKRVRSSDSDPVLLRLVGFPGAIEFDRERPLLVELDADTTSILLPPNLGRLAADAPALPNVGQFELTDLCAATHACQDLPRDRALRLMLPLASGEDVLLKIPPYIQREWLTVMDFRL